jgi:hypothetical protein
MLIFFLWWEIVSSLPNPQVGWLPPASSPWLVLQYTTVTLHIFEDFSSIHDMRIHHTVVTRDLLSIGFALLFFLWLYSPILGLGRLRETFHFISVTNSRTFGRTPWTSDQLVARPLLTAPGDCDDGEVGGMNGYGRGNWRTWRKPAPDATLSTTNPTCQTRAAAVGSQWLTASAVAWPLHYLNFKSRATPYGDLYSIAEWPCNTVWVPAVHACAQCFKIKF